MVSGTGHLVDGELSHYAAKGTPFSTGDVLFGKLRPYLAKYWLADRAGTAGGDIHVYRPSPGVEPRFLNYVVGSPDFVKYAEAVSKGTKMPRAEWMGLRKFPVTNFDIQSQRAIADFLDRETAEIDAMTAKLDELAEQLYGRKLSVIQRQTQFTTIGERWTTVPTAHLFDSIGSGTTPKEREHYTDDEDGIAWVTTSELRENEILGSNQRVTRAAVDAVSSLKVHPRGTILIAMYGATIGRLGVLGVDATVNQACCAFSGPRGIDPRYFYYTLWGQRDDIIRQAVGGGQPNISQTILRRWRVPQPPMDEQKHVVTYIDEAAGRIDEMLGKVAVLKELLIERRAALITDMVTGRKEVA
ncbi:restriction endonuclease subunit S [Herbiconiux sp. VKM Ac-1786]|uniref:restriction endonuclease subunit S n=1 Tax=Herbiconiux sp. VKM Ac-1786 TaxID=2783824 RepID=UPI001889C530|nr:restriction endonuclease subunit S [Herbiconiux sp. VKM Ac-1786]MBF4574502.1 restriction endonuclease subunit S [Herbiconiux sp. VKM Ac-1786]